MKPSEFGKWMNLRNVKIPNEVIMPASQLAVNLVRNRVINKGKKAEGGNFSAYSEGYKKKRAKRHVGRKKNFYFTGVMWKSFGIKERVITEDDILVKCRMDDDPRPNPPAKKPRSIGTGSKPKTNQELMEIHTRRESSTLVGASREEEQLVADFVSKKLDEIFK